MVSGRLDSPREALESLLEVSACLLYKLKAEGKLEDISGQEETLDGGGSYLTELKEFDDDED